MLAFSPWDLLQVQDDEQSVLRFLHKFPGATVAQIAQAIQVPAEQLEGILDQMVQADRLMERWANGQRKYTVNFRKPL